MSVKRIRNKEHICLTVCGPQGMTEKTERNKASSEVVRQSDLALLTDVQAALQQEKHHALFLMVIFLLVLVVTFVIWAWNSPLDEVTRGQGVLFPAAGSRLYRP